MREDGPDPGWKVVKQFTDGRLAVFVSHATMSFRPRYSCQVGVLRRDGSLNTHVPVTVEGAVQYRVTAGVKALGALCEQAEAWIVEEIALRTDSDLERRIEKETKDANRGRPDVRVTGKTAKKKAKLAAKGQTT